MKVQRIKQVDVSSDTHTMQITLTTSDVKYIFLNLRELLNKSAGMSFNPSFTKEDLLFTIRKHFSYLGQYATNLQDWAFEVAIRSNYIHKVGEVAYKINPTIMQMRPGKTAKAIEDFLFQ